MGSFLNPGNELFRNSRQSQIYIDKSGLIEYLNSCVNTKQKYICVSRPRRFGKSITAEMLAAYYDKSCDSRDLFRDLKIADSPAYDQHLNRHNVIHLDIQWFRSNCSDGISMIQMIEHCVIEELVDAYPQFAQEICPEGMQLTLPLVLERFNKLTGNQFVIIIDEWDCLFREDKYDLNAQKEYIQFLRGLFKGSVAERFISLAYITGILPIKKYGTESALNNFDEYTMIDPGPLSEYVGFTEKEVSELCSQYHMHFEEAKQWYDGYRFFDDDHIYSPKSVVDAMRRGRFGNYWTKTETYESLKSYIAMNFDGLRDTIVDMLGGAHCHCDTEVFQNDMTTFHSRDDVLTLLIHLGYLACDLERKEVFIPNDEVRSAFLRAIKNNGWSEVIQAIDDSEALLKATWAMDEETVACMIQGINYDKKTRGHQCVIEKWSWE